MTKVSGWVFAGLFSVGLAAGCGGEAKVAPKITDEEKAGMQKQHEETVKGSGGAPSGTPEGTK